MTEDDTFNKLRKPSLEEMSKIYHEWYNTKTYTDWPGIQMINGLHSDPDKLFKKYGWTYKEFQEASIQDFLK